MYYKISTQLPFSIMTLADAKMQCRLTDSFTIDDARLTHLIEVACELAQNYTNKLLSVGTVVMSVEQYNSKIRVVGGNVSSISSVKYQGVTGEVELTSDDYRFDDVSQCLYISDKYSCESGFTITYDAGYLESEVPFKVKQACMMIVSTLYNSNEDYSLLDVSSQSLPFTSTVLLNSVKDYAA